MHVLKQVTRGALIPHDKERLLLARGRTRLSDRDFLAQSLVASLQGLLEGQVALRGAVLETVAHTVDAEIRYISTLTKQATVIARFYEEEEERVREFGAFLGGILEAILEAVPAQGEEMGVLYVSVPLIELVRDARTLVDRIVRAIVGRHFDGLRLELGAALADVVVKRICSFSGLSFEQACEKPHRLKWPGDSDLYPRDLVTKYLGDTALGELLLSPVDVPISDRVRMEHTLITAGAGHGKSQTLQDMIFSDLDRPDGNEVGMVVIDSQGDLIDRVKRLSHFRDNDRLLLLDASDVEYPIGLNIFDLGGGGLNHGTMRDREQAFASTVQLYEYVIGGLFGSEMTSKQSVVFRFLIRLMLSIDGATIHTLRECLEEPRNFIHVMETLPPVARNFFLSEFLDRQFTETRKQILRRLYGVLQNPAFERMFASTENRVDLFDALNRGRVVLVNTSREYLQDECRVFGRYAIALSLSAAFARARLPLHRRRTSFLYCDEASDYFDETVGQLLVQARKYKLGCVLAHQALDQMSDHLRALVMANTSIKMIGGGSAKDARYMAQEMRTTPEFILAQEKKKTLTRFATYVRNVTPNAVSYTVPFFTLENAETMSDAEFDEVLARNRAEVTADPNAQWVETASSAQAGEVTDATLKGSVPSKPAQTKVAPDFSEPY